MKRGLDVAVLVCLLAGCAAAPQEAQTAGAADVGPAVSRGKLRAVMVEKGPPIDGTLASPVWRQCPPIELGPATEEKPSPLRTTARVLFGPTHLYLGVDCAEPDTDGLKRTVTERDGPVYRDDSVEFFISGDPRVGYFQFIFNAIGTWADGKFKPGRQIDKSWNSSVVVKTSVTEGTRWVLTAKIPLAELGAYVGKDQVWSMNINRNRSGGADRRLMLSWSVMEKTDWHKVNDYGIVEGVDIPKRKDGVTRVAEPLPKPPEYLTGTVAGGVRVYKKIDELTIRDEGEGTRKRIPLPIRGSRNLKIAFVARGTGGVSEVPLNVFDARARDNTTPISYYWVDEQWRPILYRASEFRYNERVNSRIAAATDFRSLFFHGNRTGGEGVLRLRDLVVYRGDDRSAPAAPTGLAAEVTADGVALSWGAASDNTAAAGYAVSRARGDGRFVKVGQPGLPRFVDKPGQPGRYRYRVLAWDFQENLGPWSKPVTVKVERRFEPDEPTREEKDRASYAAHVRAIHAAGAGKVLRGRVLCYGDSLTGATNYRHYAAAALGRYEVIAKGYPAMRTSFGAKHIDRHMKEHRPEFCLILYGTNNSKAEKRIPPAMDDLLAIARSCETHGSVPVIGTIPPRGFRDPKSKPEARFNEALTALCRKHRIPVAYIFEEYQTCGMPRRKLLAGDGVHTVSGGWVCMGKAWRAAMEQVRFVLLDRPAAK